MTATKFTTTALTPAATTKFAAELADGSKGHVLHSALGISGTWTPALTCATPGDLAQTLSTQAGFYTLIGNRVFLDVNMAWSSFTHTTASGAVTLTGLPYNASSATNYWTEASCIYGGMTLANYSVLSAYIAASANSVFNFQWSGSAQPLVALDISHIPTGGTVRLRVSINYRIA